MTCSKERIAFRYMPRLNLFSLSGLLSAFLAAIAVVVGVVAGKALWKYCRDKLAETGVPEVSGVLLLLAVCLLFFILFKRKTRKEICVSADPRTGRAYYLSKLAAMSLETEDGRWIAFQSIDSRGQELFEELVKLYGERMTADEGDAAIHRALGAEEAEKLFSRTAKEE